VHAVAVLLTEIGNVDSLGELDKGVGFRLGGVSLRDVQIAARHADPRTTMRYDRARRNLDRRANYILVAGSRRSAGRPGRV
jgi:hypothetical protein